MRSTICSHSSCLSEPHCTLRRWMVSWRVAHVGWCSLRSGPSLPGPGSHASSSRGQAHASLPSKCWQEPLTLVGPSLQHFSSFKSVGEVSSQMGLTPRPADCFWVSYAILTACCWDWSQPQGPFPTLPTAMFSVNIAGVTVRPYLATP